MRRTGDAHPFGGTLRSVSGANVRSTPLLPPNAYRSAGSLDGVASTIDTVGKIAEFATSHPWLNSYTIDMVTPGSAGEFVLPDGPDRLPYLACGAKLDPTFFDCVLHARQGGLLQQ